MKLSVIVPVYNVEKYLEKCLDSLVNQTLKDIEIIVVNDGTKDNSQKIIDKYAKKYKNIKSFIKENGGLSDARNYGMERANGEYIAFLDSDDYVALDMYEKMYNKAKNDLSDIVVCDCYKVFEDKTVNLASKLNYSNELDREYVITYPMACTRIYKRELFDDNYKFTKGIYYEDLCLTPTFVVKTQKISYINEPLYYYLQHDNSIMYQKQFSSKLLDIFDVLDHVKDVFVENNIYSKYQQEIEYLYITHLLRTATLRFLTYENTIECLIRINSIIKENFPKWRKNIYYKQSSIKLKIICNLAYNRCYKLLKLINR